MYMQWISDASVGDGEETIKKLFKLAQGDYWSVSLTLQYLKFIRNTGDTTELKRAMDKAQKTLGTHFARGHEVWALCRELTTDKFDEEEAGTKLEKERAIRELFCKQMQLPLDQNDLVMSEFRAWDAYNSLDGEAAGELEQASKRQSKVFAPLIKKLRGFEARINAAPGTEDAANPEQTWTQYLNFVKHRVAPLMANDKATEMSELSRQIVVCLYERAASVMCLSPTVWASYLEYLESDKSGDGGNEKLDVAYRAVRNVSFDSSAWSELIVEMERRRKPMDEISEFVRMELLARSSPPTMDQFHFLSALLTWCDVMRRHASTSIDGKSLEDTVQQVEALVGGVFTECEQFMTKTFPDFLEGIKRLMEYRSKCYWSLMPPGMPRLMPATVKKVNKIQQVWKQMLSTPLGEQTATWLAYFEAIQRTGTFSVTALRAAVFDEAVQCAKDSPLALAEAWVVFERECGDLDNYLRARQHHAKLHVTVPVTAVHQPIAAIPQPADAGDIKKAKNSKNPKKRKASGGSEQTTPKQPEVKRAKSGTSNASSDSAAPAVSSVAKDSKSTQNVAQKKVVHESLTNEHTLFLCNVSKDATKEDVEALFKDIPSLKDIRLVVKTRGDRVKSRGMAYVQFTDGAGVEEGLKLNGSLLDGHPLRVERSRPPSTSASTPGGKSSAGRESTQKNDPVTIFVGNLNREKSKEQVTEEQLQVVLQQAMQSAGELVVVTRVSILKDRYGKLKNYGLIELAKPSHVAFCLNNADFRKMLFKK
ncbi:hypothetical protein BBO99_00008669 [Phytophthora kernoviae]|uniref:RRM domain-containing protein n=1 Tax=Phytophthora kernoviae TaxID=325452 RepID=A0A421GEI0_9STRA|nr:hypothetical protein JM16_006986 [Phytophthora kernoviae]RLN46528.1 hypothetical protein BBI17_008552 [Phytophthora kernoviae]RLN74915.1 hypothetical protein BBO99_00008669 [Phytophthora kernoviae]